MFNAGKPLRTPEEVLFSLESKEHEAAEQADDLNVEVEPGGLDPFEEQQQLLAELGISNSNEVENDDGSFTVDFSGEKKKETEISGDFGANLAESMDTYATAAIVSQ